MSNPTNPNKIYKLNYVVNGIIQTIYVFYGKTVSSNKQKELFKEIFTNKELENINANKIQIVFCNQMIHFDDSIGTIKIKILTELKRQFSLEEIYLFCQKIETLNAVSLYQSLTQNKKLELTKIRLEQFVTNVVSDVNGFPLEVPPIKDVYTFDDILNMKIDGKKYIINKVLGQKFFIVENEYPFICDPYKVKEFDSFLEKSTRKSLTTLNSHLLLNNGNIVDNNIYVCLASDVLNYISTTEVSSQTIIKVYYPFLYNKNVNDLSELVESKETLIEGNKKVLNDTTFELFKTVDMFYGVYSLRKSELNYINRGIKFIKLIISPAFDIKIPLEIIFKVIHATEQNPLIKYNPSTRQENVYRLFTDKISTDGRKIPFLKKAVIFKAIKTIAKTKSVAILIEHKVAGTVQTIICEFSETGFITITSEFASIMTETEVNKLLMDVINPIIEEMKGLLEQSGYKLNKFTALTDENVEIKQIDYESQIQISKPINITTFKGCISSIFNDEKSKLKSTTQLRFKRVANFNKVTSQEAFVLEKSEQGLRGNEIIDALLDNFKDDLNRKQAEDIVKKVANEIQVERGVRKSVIKIKDNPGFKTIITVDQKTSIATILVENINDINYLSTIPIYLDTIIRLTQNKTSTSFPSKEINSLCSSGSKEDVVIVDIIAPIEASISEGEAHSTDEDENENENETYIDVQREKPKGALSLFFDDDDDDNEDENDTKGGSDTSSSILSDKISYKGVTIPSGVSSSEPSVSTDEEESPQIESPVQIEAPQATATDNISESAKSESSVESEMQKSLPSLPAVKSESPESAKSESSIESEMQKSLPSLPTPKPESPESAKSESSVESEIQKSLTPLPIVKPESPESVKSESSVESEIQKPLTPLPIVKPESLPPLPNIEPEVKPANVQIESDSEESKSDSDSESDSESDNENEVKNIDGMKLNKPYYFQSLIEKHDPVLILKEDTAEYNAYSRTCSSDTRRQPVILTDTQLAKINKEHNGFLRDEDVIKYGSDPNNKFNYICPRYWCLKTNTIIDPKDLKEVVGKDGKKELVHPTCGKVLARGDKTVKPGHYIYEFFQPNDKNPKRYPGFQTDKHPAGYCLPCCFDKYNTAGRIKAKEKCSSDDSKEKTKDVIKPEINDDYIKGPDKFPLDAGRWGYLPPGMQKMLHEVNADCQISKTNTNIKQNHPCLLRHGVEISKKQSFVACISDAIFFGKKLPDENKGAVNTAQNLSIKDMRTRIIKSLTIDNFIKYQNGNLVTDFNNYKNNMAIDVNKYANSKLFAKINKTNDSEMIYFKKVISAFENFTSFLNDEDAIIDHTYLWDIVSMPNKFLFPTGVNLVIFQLPNDDITNNVQLLCPTNHYSSEFYEARKPTIILMKEDGYYEPIYSYMSNNNKLIIAKEFKEYDPQLSKTMRAVIKEIIKPFFKTICAPLDSMPNIYKAKRPLILFDLIQKLDKYEYKLIKLVLNFNNKIIGVVAEEPGVSTKKGFIPCYPSAIDEDLKPGLTFVFMTDLTLWNNYNDTVQFLLKLYKRSSKRKERADIPCKPAFKIIEDELVVGILTETNQFIQISQPISEQDVSITNNLPSFKNNNYIVNVNSKPMVSIDVPTSINNGIDKERVDYIKKIKSEANFYNVFRNTIRILLNDYENNQIRERIIKENENKFIIYSEKLHKIDSLLKELVRNKIRFVGDENFYKLIDDVSTCVIKDKDKCTNTPNLCALSENDDCDLILPEKNLITHKENSPIYFGRMSDELVRYSRIKNFMFQPQTYLSFGNVGYNLRDNEIIMIQSLLTQEYFESFIPSTQNKYIINNSYDEAEPVMTQIYENTIPSLDHAIGKNANSKCEVIIKKITSGAWKHCFPENYKEVEYSKFNNCTFQFIIDIIERKLGKKLSINEIKNELYNEYKKYLIEYQKKIVDVLIIEGKKTLGDQVRSETLSFSSFIYTDNYFLTTLDLWLLIQKYEIPTIFICQKTILQTEYKTNVFVGYGEEADDFIFIMLPAFKAENVPSFKIIQNDEGGSLISIKKLNEECIDKIREAVNVKIGIKEYLNRFTKPTGNYKKKNNLIIEEDSLNEPAVKKIRAQKLQIQEDSPVSLDEILKPSKMKTKKKLVLKGNPKTKKNLKKALIIESSSA